MWDRLAASLLAAALCLPGAGLADELIFKNGDRLTGTVVRLADGKLSFDSKVVGSVTAAVGELESFTTQQPIELHLTDGRVVSDRVVLADSGSVRFAGDRSQVGFAEIEEINPEPVRWHGSVAAGLTLERGNTDSQDANIEFRARRTADDYRFNLRLRYKGERSRSGGGDYVTDDRIYRGTTQYDHFLRDRLFAYGRLSGERDGVADLDLRTITGSGLGYQLFKRSDFSFDIQGGLAWVHDDYGTFSSSGSRRGTGDAVCSMMSQPATASAQPSSLVRSARRKLSRRSPAPTPRSGRRSFSRPRSRRLPRTEWPASSSCRMMCRAI